MKRALVLLLLPTVLSLVGCSRPDTAGTGPRGGTAIPPEPGFTEPAPAVRTELMPAVQEYFDVRKAAVVAGDVQVLWDRYPALTEGADPGGGINNEAAYIEGMRSLKPVGGSINPEYYEPMRIKLEGDFAQMTLHGMELYTRPEGQESGGEFHLKLYLERRGSGWTVVRTDEVTLGELHAILEGGSNLVQPLFCGREDRQHGQGRNQAARDCLWEAHQSGRAATFISRLTTDEGDPIIWTVNVAGKNQITVEVDTRQDKFGEQKITKYSCRGLQLTQPKGGAEIFVFTECTGGPNPELRL